MDITITKDEKEKAIQGQVNDCVVKALQDPRTIEAIQKATGGKAPVDPRNKPNYKRWNDGLGAFPASTHAAEGVNHHKARAKAIVSAFLGEEGSEQRERTAGYINDLKLKGSGKFVSPEFHVEAALAKAGLISPYVKGKGFGQWGQVVSKASEVTNVSNLTTVAGTEYDPEIHAFPTRKVHLEDLMASKPCDKSVIDFLQEYGYSGSSSYGAIPGNQVAAVLQVDDPTSPLSLTDSTMRADLVSIKVANMRTKITVASELLDDINDLASYMEMRIETMGQYTMDAEIASGSGTPPHMLGMYVDPLCQTYAWSAGNVGDNQADAVLHGIILAWLAEHEPDSIPMSPLDWGAIVMLKDAIDGYLIPSAHTKDNAKVLWGLDVVPTTGNPEGYCMPGSWSTSAILRDRQASTLNWVRDYGTDRDSNLVRLFFNRRATVQRIRPEGFVAVHFDAPPT